MKKIFNWTFGSIFRTFGRIIAYLSVGLLIASILSKTGFKLTDFLTLNVKAATVDGWTLGLDGLNEVFMYDCNGAENCSNNIKISAMNIVNTDRYYVSNAAPAIVHKNGVVIHLSESNTYQPGYLYSARVYLCSDIKAKQVSMFSTNWTNRNKGISYDTYNSSVQNYSLSSVPYGGNTEMTFNNCSAYGVIFSPSTITTGIEIRFKSPNSSQNVNFDILGMDIENLGVYDNSLINKIGEIINKSGYATAESVEEVNVAVNEVKQELNGVNSSINNGFNNLNDNLNNSDISEANDNASGFFNNFSTNTHGLTGIITAPLNAIQSLTSKTCSPLVLPLPFVDKDLTLPCMREIYVDNFGAFMDIYDVITLGIISYWVMVRIFALVKDFKNPDHDEIEVMDL